MLIIRDAQLDTFQEAAWRPVEAAIIRRVREAFPADCAGLGEAGVRALVAHGVRRARAFGALTLGHARRYVCIATVLGGELHDDPQLPWAASILSGDDSPDDRFEALHDRALAHLAAVAGEDGATYRRALQAARDVSFERYTQTGDSDAAVLDLLAAIHPARVADLRAQGVVEATLARCDARRSAVGLGAPEFRALFATIMALLGGSFDDDPAWPWAREALSARADPSARARALHAAAAARVDLALAASRQEEGAPTSWASAPDRKG